PVPISGVGPCSPLTRAAARSAPRWAWMPAARLSPLGGASTPILISPTEAGWRGGGSDVQPAIDRTIATNVAPDNTRMRNMSDNTPRQGRIRSSWLSIIRRQPASRQRGREIQEMKTSPSSASEQRRPIFLRDWRGRSKLIAGLVTPAVAFLVLSSFGIGSLVRNAQAFDDGRRLADLGREGTPLVHELQAERDLSGPLIESRQAKVAEALDAQRPRVDRAAAAYRNAEAPLYDDLGDRLRGRFDAVRSDLDSLSALRDAISQRSLSRRAIGDEFSRMIDQLLDLNGEIAQPGGDPDLAQSVTALNDLSRAKEITSQVRGTLSALAIRGQFEVGGFQESSGLLAQQQTAFAAFQADAGDAQRALFASTVQGQAVLQVDRIQTGAVRGPSPQSVNPDQWLNASTTNMELLRSVESQLLDGIIGQSGDLSATARRDALRNVLLIAVILGIALLALLLVARSMAQPLQRLRAGAIEIAQHRLPEAVQRLRTTESGDLDVGVESLGIRSKDEIGQV